MGAFPAMIPAALHSPSSALPRPLGHGILNSRPHDPTTLMTRDRSKKVVVVLPAYNAEKTLRDTYDDIPKEWVDEILLVDDASRDRTVDIARQLGIRTIVHPRNRGYGGNQKT